MAAKSNPGSFDPKEFLAKVGEGKTIVRYHKNQIVTWQLDLFGKHPPF